MRTAFHLTSGDEDDQKSVLTIAENLSNDETIEMDETVSSGASELTRLQDDDYAYLRH